ncbi:MAG: hypothetical protein J6I80_00880 [Clostridia bacterium]|nr:hypothetical protein [Clostridia bacterium]
MRNVLLGTDWGSDVDDVVAVRILARAHKLSKINLTGIAINHCMENSVTSLEGFLNTEGVFDVPIGIDKNAHFGKKPTYQNILCEYARKYRTNDDVVDAVRLYREILANKTEKVDIIEIGFLQVLAAVLKSGADDISDKTGAELIKQKVNKLWIMGANGMSRVEKSLTFPAMKLPVPPHQRFVRFVPYP